MRKVTAFGTIAIEIFAFVIIGLHGLVKKIFCFLDLVSYSGQVSQPEWSAIFVYQILQRDPVESEAFLIEVKALLGKKIGLVYKLKICVFHCGKPGL